MWRELVSAETRLILFRGKDSDSGCMPAVILLLIAISIRAGLDMVINAELPISSNRAVGLTVCVRRYFAILAFGEQDDCTLWDSGTFRHRLWNRGISQRDCV
jgi:hypothetical protein